MRIAFEEPLHAGGKGGVSAYTRHLLREMVRLAPEHEFVLFGFFFRSYQERLKTVRAEQAPGLRFLLPRWPESLVSLAEWKAGLPWIESYLKLHDVDLYHAHRIPRRHWLKTVVTIHDLFPVVHPEWASPYFVQMTNDVWKPGTRRVDRIIAVSELTKRVLTNRWGIAEENIEVVHEGVDREIFRPLADEPVKSARARYALPARFLLMVGPFDPWSDPGNALRALARLPKHLSETAFVMCGQPGSLGQKTKALIRELGLDARVHWTGYVPQQDLVALYNSAQALLFPSFYEGFGLPVLEAMACGTPVIASTAGALPEVAGDAGIQVNPHDVDQIADALSRVLDKKGLQIEMRGKGLRRVELFSWERAALKTLAVYRSVAG